MPETSFEENSSSVTGFFKFNEMVPVILVISKSEFDRRLPGTDYLLKAGAQKTSGLLNGANTNFFRRIFLIVVPRGAILVWSALFLTALFAVVDVVFDDGCEIFGTFKWSRLAL